MKNTNWILLIFVFGLLAGPMTNDARADFDYQTIEYPGADFTQVFGINDRGDVVGTAFVEDACIPFVYDIKSATFTDVEPVAGFDCTNLISISDSGYMVGSVTLDDPFSRSGLILDKRNNAMTFDHPNAFSQTVARGVNNTGLVTGYRDGDQVQGEPLANAFIYDSRTDTYTDIVPSLFTLAQGINSKGDVVGSAIFVDIGIGPTDPCGTEFNVRYGWLRKADGTVIYFNVNGWRTSARGITDSGTIVGWALDPATGTAKSFVTELDGTQCQSIDIPESGLLVFPDLNAAAQGIKNSGEIIGNSFDANHGLIAIPKRGAGK